MSIMSEKKPCAQCGAELTADSPYGLCPGCLLKRGLETQSAAGEGGSQSGAGDFQPPTPAELAPYFPELEILALIGKGGMGVVYKARQKRLDRLVALKILAPAFGQDPAFAERFHREARAMGMLNHPHIVAVHDFGQTNGLYYFVMEFVDGVNLRRPLEMGKLSPEQALAIVPQICDALQYAHNAGVVHRDIKPENILLDKSGRVKIADFGLAKLTGQTQDVTLTGAGQVMGTPHYMAPEQLEHPQAVDHRADIYSLGVVFYQMLTGELPIGRFALPSRKVQVDVRLDEVVLRAGERAATAVPASQRGQDRRSGGSEYTAAYRRVRGGGRGGTCRPAWNGRRLEFRIANGAAAGASVFAAGHCRCGLGAILLRGSPSVHGLHCGRGE